MLVTHCWVQLCQKLGKYSQELLGVLYRHMFYSTNQVPKADFPQYSASSVQVRMDEWSTSCRLGTQTTQTCRGKK